MRLTKNEILRLRSLFEIDNFFLHNSPEIIRVKQKVEGLSLRFNISETKEVELNLPLDLFDIDALLDLFSRHSSCKGKDPTYNSIYIKLKKFKEERC